MNSQTTTLDHAAEQPPQPLKTIELSGKRLQVTARAAGIDFREAFFWRNGRWPKRIVTGIYVAPADEEKMRAAIAARDAKRPTPEQRAAARRAKQERETNDLLAAIRSRFPGMPPHLAESCAEHATEIGSGRVGRSTSAEDPARCAVVAYVRHHLTDYDGLLAQGYDRDEARQEVGEQIRATLAEWETSPPAHEA